MIFHDCTVGEPDPISADVAAALADTRRQFALARANAATWDLPDYEPAP